ncbi:MAG: polysaccharide deacetylase family protein [Rhodospirillales bacterium]
MISFSITMAARRLMAISAVAGGMLAAVASAHAEVSTAAVALMYHRFGDDRFPSTNVTLDQLDAHIAELRSGGYNVVHLSTIVDAMERGEALPDRTVAITIDDAYRTVFEAGWPKFRDAGMPVTLFVSTGPIDQGLADMMTWDQLRQMQAEGAEIGGHTVSHLHMPEADETRNRAEMTESNARFEAELGQVPTLFAYPYGEASSALLDMVREVGYRAAFGQHSGAMSDVDDRFYLPRFPLNETYADMGRFKTAVNAMPLAVSDLTPADMTVRPDDGEANPPAVGFTVMDDVGDLDQLTCFFSHEGAASIERIGSRRIEVRATTPMPKGRSRLNCTLPGRGEHSGRWYWYGRQFVIPGG